MRRAQFVPSGLRRAWRLGAAAALALSLGAPRAANGAEPDATARAVDDARASFAEGSAHYQAHRPAEALAAFERSYRLVESPNTELLMGRCLRELGRRPEALLALEHAAREAPARMAQGESKYAATAEAAAGEAARLRAALGTVHVHVARKGVSSILVDGREVPLSAQGEATIVHEPGTAAVVVRDAAGADQRQSVTVLAGSAVDMDFSAEAARPEGRRSPMLLPPAAGTTTPAGASRWQTPAAWTAGGIAVAGLGTFVLFGLRSQATYDALAAQCGPDACGAADRARADEGKRDQVIANVALGVGIAAAVATLGFVASAVSARKSL